MSTHLPKRVECRECGVTLTLSDRERSEGKYTCPVCNGVFDIKRKELICPQCRAEYVSGIEKCADCHIPLVPYIPAKHEKALHDYVEVLSTYNASDVAVIKSLLNAEKIKCQFRGEIFNLTWPLVQPVRLFVKEDQAEAAKKLLKGMPIRFTGVSPAPAKEK